MKKISELFHTNKGWFDYPVENGEHRSYRVNGPKPFKVYHKDGSFSYAYSYGEYHYTFSIEERDAARKEYFENRAKIGERNALIKKFGELDTETMKRLLAMIEK